MIRSLDRIDVNGVELEYEMVGKGTPVLLIHGSFVADACLPLMAQPELRDRYRLITYHRRGFAGSTRITGPVSITEQAADCAGLLRILGVEPAYVAGHSYGGVIALQLAVDSPGAVRSLALLEPSPLFLVPSGGAFMEGVAPVIDAYQKGDKRGAVVGFHQGFWGTEAEATMEKLVPGSVAQATADADTFFQVEMPALQDWNLTAEQAARISVPVLFVQGERTWPIFGEVHDLVHRWLPKTRDAVIPGASHPFHVEEPGATARALATFFAQS
jgi:pimeloyl-ACP methyl ester carboxylesterase